MQLVQVNNSFETFTSSASGAIATHIWEVSRRAKLRSLVMSRSSSAATLEGIEVEHLPPSPERVPGWREWRGRLIRRFTGWREAEQRSHARNVARALRRRGLTRSCLLLHNDPEMAVYLRAECPEARIVHHFHNPVIVKDVFRRRFSASVNAVTAVSEYVADEVRNLYGMKSVKVVYNGVDLERFKPAPRKNAQRITFNFLGRTGIEKAPDVLLRAAVKLALEGFPLRVQLIGSNHWGRWEADAYQAQLANLCEEVVRAGGEVCATGHLSREQVPVQLRNADVHVLPSRWEEPCALSLLEGMSSGLPVVATRTGGTPEILGQDGLLFSKDSVVELCSHLRKLLADEPFRLSLGARARRRAQSFTWERCLEGFMEVIA